MKHLLHIGPQKTASSLIHSLVCRKIDSDHAIKENFYFQLNNSYDYDEYLDLFPKHKSLVFDCSPSYFSDVSLIKPILKLIPNPTIIVGFRDVNKLFNSFAKHQYSLGQLTRQQLNLSQFKTGFFDPVRYSLHAPKWFSSFDHIFILKVDLFLSSLDYRLNVMNYLFPSLGFVSSDLHKLQAVNEAHAYRFGLGHLRRFTPYINRLPASHHITRVKKSILNYLPKQANTPIPNLSSPKVQSIIQAEIQYCKTIPIKLDF